MGKMVVLGAGGFIGGHLAARLQRDGHDVLGVDFKPRENWWQRLSDENTYDCFDVGNDYFSSESLLNVMRDADVVFNLAANMGGIGFIESAKLPCMLSVLPSVHALRTAHHAGAQRFFFASSACVYPGYRQDQTAIDIADGTPRLRESDAYPADAEDGYGWEKLFTERLCRHYRDEAQLPTRVARYHNVYGPLGAWDGGREKSPAALCRKVAIAKLTGQTEIEIWGDGRQTRSYLYVDDAVNATFSVAFGDYADPVNVGSSHAVSINGLAYLVAKIAGITDLQLNHILGAQGVRGRASDNRLFTATYGYDPVQTVLHDGVESTYAWIYDQVKKRGNL